MNIMVGLGNPGTDFEHTYHNAGALALEAIMKAAEIDLTFKAYKKLYEYAQSEHTAFIRPLTFMNESGKAVSVALKKYEAKSNDLVVFHDDSDITIGNYKISIARNAGGHHGVESIIDAIGTNEFTRVRIGIRPARELKRKKAGEFALKPITKQDMATLNKVFEEINEAIQKTYSL
jgi:PTH1 family peptidyl-tRNA hydrolase